VAGLLREHPARVEQTDEGDLVQGLAVRVRVERPQAVGEVDLGEQGRFWPTNEALAAWKALAGDGQARIVYEVESR
jgi:DNA polymerase-3 subunit alpha